MIKLGLIRETKTPEDNRVALTPMQVKLMQEKFSNVKVLVQPSPTRCYSDFEYLEKGIELSEDLSGCDVLLGIKEASIDSLINGKHYLFFGHIAKMQLYNKPLLEAMINKNITFSDYEYLVDENNSRVCAFGWWAGVVGVYNTLRAYGIKYKKYDLPMPDRSFTLEKLLTLLLGINQYLGNVKILLTGNGRVSHGAQFVLDKIKLIKLSYEQFKEESLGGYFVVDIDNLVEKVSEENNKFNISDFKLNPHNYKSRFMQYAEYADVLISCHFWSPQDPVYLSSEDLRSEKMKIKVIGDVTCDIMGSIKSTLRSSTHSNPFYDYNPVTMGEELPFENPANITVMAVDTLPNALARDTSEYFGNLLLKHVINPLLESGDTTILERATILKKGSITSSFSYLKDFINNK